MTLLFQVIGSIGLILVTIGVLAKQRRKQDIFFIFGGMFLTIYSIYLKNTIFIALQIIFIIASVYSLIEIKKKKTNKFK